MDSKILTLKKLWIQKAFHATYSAFARGVIVLVHKNFPCMIEEIRIDPQGKFVLLVFTLWFQRYITHG